MALIVCRGCKKDYSDKALACPFCNRPTINNTGIECKECGREYDPDSKICPNCGCPTTYNYSSSFEESTYNDENINDSFLVNKIRSRFQLVVPIIILNLIIGLLTSPISGSTILTAIAIVLLFSCGYIIGNLHYMITNDLAVSVILGIISCFSFIGIFVDFYVYRKTKTSIYGDILD